LCVKALGLAATPGVRELHEMTTRTTLALIEGETLQEIMVGRLDVDVDECFRAIELKTGRLMACSCETAAVLAGGTPEERAALREYGLQLGMAFQIADDMLDFVSDESTLGKPVLNDLREGKLSIPAIHAFRTGDGETRRVIEAVVSDRGFSRATPAEVVAAVRESGGLDVALDFAKEASA